MSRIARTGNPFTVTLRRRLLAGAMAAAALTGLSAHSVFAQDIVVSGGAVQSNSSPATYNSIDVSGTDGSSNPSTYNADAPLTLTSSLFAHDFGVFNANADVSLVNAYASSAGVINLNTGTLTAPGLSFFGVGSVARSAGSYSASSLTLSNGATLGYDAGDSITSSVSLASGAALTLDQNLTLSSALYLQNGGSITRTSETISALAFYVDNATLDLLAGDTFSPGSLSYVRNGALVNAPAGTSIGYLSVWSTNGNGDRATFNVNGNVTVNGAAVALPDSVINLIAGTLSTPSLSFSGAGSAGQSAATMTSRISSSTAARRSPLMSATASTFSPSMALEAFSMSLPH